MYVHMNVTSLFLLFFSIMETRGVGKAEDPDPGLPQCITVFNLFLAPKYLCRCCCQEGMKHIHQLFRKCQGLGLSVHLTCWGTFPLAE